VPNLIRALKTRQEICARLQRAIEKLMVVQRFHLWLPSMRISDAQLEIN
jgi:hypothetical protein